MVSSLKDVHSHVESRGRFRLLYVLVFVLVAVSVSVFVLSEIGRKGIFVVDVRGGVGSGGVDGRDVSMLLDGISADDVDYVLVYLDSSGGSLVHAEMIYESIKRLRVRAGIEVDGLVGDVCVGSCYLIAQGVGRLYVHGNSVVGGVGVSLSSYKIAGLAKRVGVDKYFYNSGDYNSVLDPFSYDSEFVRNHIKEHIVSSSAEYISSVVVERRGVDIGLLNGLFWLGRGAVDNGFADEVVDYGLLLERKKAHYGARDVVLNKQSIWVDFKVWLGGLRFGGVESSV